MAIVGDSMHAQEDPDDHLMNTHLALKIIEQPDKYWKAANGNAFGSGPVYMPELMNATTS